MGCPEKGWRPWGGPGLGPWLQGDSGGFLRDSSAPSRSLKDQIHPWLSPEEGSPQGPG